MPLKTPRGKSSIYTDFLCALPDTCDRSRQTSGLAPSVWTGLHWGDDPRLEGGHYGRSSGDTIRISNFLSSGGDNMHLSQLTQFRGE